MHGCCDLLRLYAIHSALIHRVVPLWQTGAGREVFFFWRLEGKSCCMTFLVPLLCCVLLSFNLSSSLLSLAIVVYLQGKDLAISLTMTSPPPPFLLPLSPASLLLHGNYHVKKRLMLLDWISDRVKEEEETGCCSGRRAMRIHGGGQATSAPNSQNGSTTTSKVIIYGVFSSFVLHFPVFLHKFSCWGTRSISGFFNHDSWIIRSFPSMWLLLLYYQHCHFRIEWWTSPN